MPVQNNIYSTQIRDAGRTNVLVVGSGVAGAIAALTAARRGAAVTLLERYGFMGGISTQTLDTFYGFYTPGEEPRKVVGGVPDLIVKALQREGKAFLRPNTHGAGIGVTYDPERLKILWEQLALKSGMKLRFHTFVVDVLQEGDRITGVIAAGKDGLVQLRADAIIDATGDADLAAAAGAPFDGVKAGKVQAMTTTFRLVNVDMDTALNVPADTLHRLLKDAAETNKYVLPHREGSVHVTPIEGVVATNLVRVSDVDGTDPEQLTRAEIDGRHQALEYLRFLRDCVPGYGHAELVSLSTQIGIRESRRIRGRYRLTRGDVLSVRRFDDVIGRSGAPIEVHNNGDKTRWEYLPEGKAYDIPFRCLLPREVEGLVVAGRCLSADQDAHASVRNMAQCMAMGQAAGAAAALAVQHETVPGDVNIPELQDVIRSLGGIL